MSHILAGADIVRTKIREDKIKDYLLQYIKSGYFPEIVFCKNMKIKFQIFYHWSFADLGMVSFQRKRSGYGMLWFVQEMVSLEI